MDTDEEVIRFVAENTFLDGESLNAVFPMIEEFLVEYRAQGEDDLDKIFNFDDFRITPRNLRRGEDWSYEPEYYADGYYDEEREWHFYEDMLTEDNQRDG